MTTNKDFKSLVRQRMAQTGENYTTALQVLSHQRDAYALARTEHQKIIGRFFDADGHLVAMPAKRKVRASVLLAVLARFEPGRRYSEAEANRVLAPVDEDVATLRRYLLELGYLERDNATSTYWVTTVIPEPLPNPEQEVPAWELVWLPQFIESADPARS